jgi:hypothetical protein
MFALAICLVPGSTEPQASLENYSAARVQSGMTEMHSILGSACLLVMLLPAPLSGASPSGATPVVAGEPMSGRSHPQLAKAACGLPDSCVAQASAGEPAESRPVETGQSPAPTPPCQQVAGLFARAPTSIAKPADPWGVELVGSSSDATALAAYRQLQEKYTSILAGREPRVIHHGIARGSMGWARVHVGAESRTSVEKLCANLRAAGASCWVQHN